MDQKSIDLVNEARTTKTSDIRDNPERAFVVMNLLCDVIISLGIKEKKLEEIGGELLRLGRVDAEYADRQRSVLKNIIETYFKKESEMVTVDIGDVVRIVKDPKCAYDDRRGQVGFVEKIDGPRLFIRFDSVDKLWVDKDDIVIVKKKKDRK